MLTAPFAARLAATPPTLRAWLADLPDPDARWQPPGGGWSVVEILGHLADEDELDFGRRLRLLVEQPGTPWPAIDPEATVRERDHAARPLAEQLARLEQRRAERLAWLARHPRLGDAPTYRHPALGTFTPAQLLAAWVAHDLLHLRQVGKLLWQLVQRDVAPRRLDYAGPAPG